MPSFAFFGYQFFSREAIELMDPGSFRTRATQRMDVAFDVELSIVPKPFPLSFASFAPNNPSTGAAQFIDRDEEGYFTARWPSCLMVQGQFHIADSEVLLNEDFRFFLKFVRVFMWQADGGSPNPNIPPDQRATLHGYRREFFHQQTFDILGNRRPSPARTYVETAPGTPVGPGVVSLESLPSGLDNEFAWSQVVPFPLSATTAQGKTNVKHAIQSMEPRANAHSELSDALRYREAGDLKAAIRFAAAAVEVSMKVLATTYGVPIPADKGLSFDARLDRVLLASGRAPLNQVDTTLGTRVKYLYRARNSMHDGKCEYKRDDNTLVVLYSIDDALPLLEAAEKAVWWIEALA